jgi:hypothetical protein
MITDATVTHVPVELADDWRWWEPQRLQKGPRWFYGVRKGGQARPALTAAPETVDGPLRPLVAMLSAAQVQTLPSCAGHFSSPAGLRETYAELSRDAAWIRGHGLTVRCSETGELRTLRSSGWRLPSFAAWAAPALAANGHGRIGLVLPPTVARRWSRRLNRCGRGVSAQIRPWGASPVMLDVYVRTDGPGRQRAAWQAVTRCVRKLLGGSSPTVSHKQFVEPKSPPSTYAIAGLLDGEPGSLYRTIEVTALRAFFIGTGLYVSGLRGAPLLRGALMASAGVTGWLLLDYSAQMKGLKVRQ